MKALFSCAAIVLFAASAAAQNDLSAIQDNSFLVEEAYNQEDGVVQHINVFSRDQKSGDWLYTFTQEWPVGSQKHQFSYTLPVTGGTSERFGDMLLNYRYQLLGSGETRTAIAPRVSIIVPTGGGSSGVQAAIPLSRVLGERVAAHSNAGATWYHDSRTTDLFLGQSFIYALSSRVHLMTEATWTRSQHQTDVVVSPGLRWAYNLSGGLQIVPGVAVPIGVGPSAGERSLVLYLSFEHPFLRRAGR
ncbi:MAG TPA: transporter [Thermoanaerobaculia bacterium]|nr:transporter [Thermoanaerobaculia bacterium]